MLTRSAAEQGKCDLFFLPVTKPHFLSHSAKFSLNQHSSVTPTNLTPANPGSKSSRGRVHSAHGNVPACGCPSLFPVSHKWPKFHLIYVPSSSAFFSSEHRARSVINCEIQSVSIHLLFVAHCGKSVNFSFLNPSLMSEMPEWGCAGTGRTTEMSFPGSILALLTWQHVTKPEDEKLLTAQIQTLQLFPDVTPAHEPTNPFPPAAPTGFGKENSPWAAGNGTGEPSLVPQGRADGTSLLGL